MPTTSPRLKDGPSFNNDGMQWKEVAFAETCVGRTRVERNGLKYELRAVVQIVPLPADSEPGETIDDLPNLENEFAAVAIKRLFQPDVVTLIGF